MRIDTDTLKDLCDRVETIAVAILGDVLDGNSNAQFIHGHIGTAADIMGGWYDADIDTNEFLFACNELDIAIDALTKYAENLAESLIITRYWLERAPQ